MANSATITVSATASGASVFGGVPATQLLNGTSPVIIDNAYYLQSGVNPLLAPTGAQWLILNVAAGFTAAQCTVSGTVCAPYVSAGFYLLPVPAGGEVYFDTTVTHSAPSLLAWL